MNKSCLDCKHSIRLYSYNEFLRVSSREFKRQFALKKKSLTNSSVINNAVYICIEAGPSKYKFLPENLICKEME